MKKFLTVYEISSMSEDELKNVYSQLKKMDVLDAAL
jgi:hypothetical protein